MSAHVSLGKIFLDQDMLDKASTEFEQVVSVMPDNLYAHKRLAEIYNALNMREKAIEEFKIVLKLNPLDWDAEKSLTHLGGGVGIQPGSAEHFEVNMAAEKSPERTVPESFNETGETPFGLEGIIEETSVEENLPELKL